MTEETREEPATDAKAAAKTKAKGDAKASGDEKRWGDPSFAKDFPADPELQRLVEAFARGDYATVRADAPKLATSSEDDAVKQAAQMLRQRIEPDPTSRLLFLFAGLLLAFLTVWWVTHDGPEGGRTPPAPLTPAPPVVEHVR